MFLRRLLVSVFLVTGGFSLPATAHDIHATITEIEWNERDNSLEVILSMHAELLEARLSLDLGEKLSFLQEADTEKLEAATAPLLNDHLSLTVDDTHQELVYLGLEYRGDEVFIYLEAERESAPKHMEVMNSLFLDDLPGQINTVVIRIGDTKAAGKLMSGSDPLLFEIK